MLPVVWKCFPQVFLLSFLRCCLVSCVDSDSCAREGDDCVVRPTRCFGLDVPDTNRPEPQVWQAVKERKVIVFSAFADRRSEVGGPLVRVIAAGWQAAYRNIGALYCQLWYEGEKVAVVAGEAIYRRIYPSTMHHESWCSHFILCPLDAARQGQFPYAVSVTSERCQTASNSLVVLNRVVPAEAIGHVLCLPTIYNGFDDWVNLIENFELHRLLAIDHITVYRQRVGDKVEKILQHYHKNDFLNAVNWYFPENLESNVFVQRGAINDCLYRALGRFKYVSVTDLDEILMPRQDDTLPKLMDRLSVNNRGAFLFEHVYFRRNMSETDVLVTTASLWRTDKPFPPGKIRCKALYVASRTVSLDLHFPYELTAGSSEFLIPQSIGLLHHYRKDPMETFRKNPGDFHFIEDTYVRRLYKSKLEDVVNRQIKLVT